MMRRVYVPLSEELYKALRGAAVLSGRQFEAELEHRLSLTIQSDVIRQAVREAMAERPSAVPHVWYTAQSLNGGGS